LDFFHERWPFDWMNPFFPLLLVLLLLLLLAFGD
jgi:hypothetical protein